MRYSTFDEVLESFDGVPVRMAIYSLTRFIAFARAPWRFHEDDGLHHAHGYIILQDEELRESLSAESSPLIFVAHTLPKPDLRAFLLVLSDALREYSLALADKDGLG